MPKFKPVILHEDCAPRRVLELFSVKWTTMVLHSLHFNGGTCRTGTLARSLPGRSKKMLTQTLREMERDGLIDRKVYPVVPPRVEYSLTPMGRLFIEADRDAICVGGQERRGVVEAEEEAEEAHGFERQSEEDSIILRAFLGICLFVTGGILAVLALLNLSAVPPSKP